jgi:uncharacterized protein YeaO (DUF488 family)
MSELTVKRIYEPFSKNDGYRILVDRLWPRGVKKEEAHIDRWLKDVAPSAALRKWFNHDVSKWDEFCATYRRELKDSAAYNELLAAIGEHKMVTLLFGAKDEKHNQAVALKRFLS